MRTFFLFLLLTFSLEAAKVQTVIFDYSGVVARLDKAKVLPYIRDTFSFSKEEFEKAKQRLGDAEAKFGFWEREAYQLGKEVPNDYKQQIKRQNAQALEENPGMFSLIHQLQKKGFETALFANAEEEIAQIIAEKGHLIPFDAAVFSYQIDAKKPKRLAFERMLEILERTPGDCLFIDDKRENVAVAEALGFEAILFKNMKQLKKELRKKGHL